LPAHSKQRAAASALTADALRPVLVRLVRDLRREATALGITIGQADALARIAERPGLGVRELAELEGIAAPTAWGLIERLERDGLISRVRSDNDRRRVMLNPTAAGRRMLRSLRTRGTIRLAERLEQLEERDRAAIAAALGPLARLGGGER